MVVCLLLRCWAPNEATPPVTDSQPSVELWTVPEDGGRFYHYSGNQQRHVDKDGNPNKQTTSLLVCIHKLSFYMYKTSDVILIVFLHGHAHVFSNTIRNS